MVTKDEMLLRQLGETLKSARHKAGYTREQLAERVNISVRHLTSIENAEKRASYEVLYHLIRNLGISADLIFYPETSNDSDAQQTMRLYQNCSERDRALIRSMIDAMLDHK